MPNVLLGFLGFGLVTRAGPERVEAEPPRRIHELRSEKGACLARQGASSSLVSLLGRGGYGLVGGREAS